MEIIDYKIGVETPLGKITKVYVKGMKYIIYETDNRGNIAREIDFDIDLTCLNILNNINIEIQSLLTTKYERQKFAGNIALAYSECCEGNEEAGVKLLENLLETIKNYRRLKSRIAYMMSAMLFVIINLIICALINTIWKEPLNKYLKLLFTIATFGSLGGLISILSKIQKLDLELYGNNLLQAIDGFSRIFLSMISSVIIFVLIKSDIVLSTFNSLPNNNIFYAFAIISGFSEKFIPDVIKLIEKKKLE